MRGLRSYLRSVAVLASGPALQFLAIIVVARTIPVSDAALYFLISAPIPFLLSFTGLSSSEMAIREIALKPHENRVWMARSLALMMISLPFTVAAFVLLLLAVSAEAISTWVLLLIGGGELLGQRLVLIAEHEALARREIRRADGYRFMLACARPLAIFSFAALASGASAIGYLVAGAAVTMAMGLVAMRHAWGSGKLYLARPAHVWDCVSFAANVAVRNGQFSLDRVVLARALPAADFAAYAVAVRVVQAMLIPLTVISRETLPKYYQLAQQPDSGFLQLVRQTRGKFIAAGLAITAGTIILSLSLPVLMGPAYQSTGWLLLYMAPFAVVQAVYLAGQDVLLGLDRNKTRLVINILYVAGQLIALGLLAFYAGLGGAIAALLATGVAGAIMPWLATRTATNDRTGA